MKINFHAESTLRKMKAYLVESSSNSKILLDCGISAKSIEQPILPNYIIPDIIIPDIDAIFITHAHIDHWGLLPQLIIKGYKKSVFMPKTTYEMLDPAIKFYFRKVYPEERRNYYNAFTKLITLAHKCEFGEVIELKDFKVYFLPANHILGSAQILVEEKNSNKQILYTGDINPRGSCLFKPLHVQKFEEAYNIEINPKAVIIETSNVDLTEEEFIEEENIFINNVNETYDNYGDVLIPISAIGDAQDFITRYLNDILQERIIMPIDIFTTGSLLNVNKIYFKHKNVFRNPEIVDLFDKTLILKILDDYIRNDPSLDWNSFFNNPRDFGNKLFIATGGNLVGSASRVYNFLRNNSQNLIIRPKRFDVRDCKAKILSLRIFSLHGNCDSILRYINELEELNNTRYFLVHGSYEKLLHFNDILNKKDINNIIPKMGESYNIK